MGFNGDNGSFGVPESFTPAEQAALKALMAAPMPVASPQARHRAHLAFTRGDEEGAARLASEAIKSPRRFLLAVFAPFASAAVILIAILIYGVQPEYQWRIATLSNPAGIELNVETLEVGAKIESGLVANAVGSEIGIQLGDQLRFNLMPGSKITLPKPPGRWFNKKRVIQLAEGEIYGTTGGNPLAFNLSVKTEEATARILGTTFAVFRFDFGTCVCLWTGGVEVTPVDADEATRMLEEMKFIVYNDGRDPVMLPIDDMERMKLSMTHDAGLLPELPNPR